MEFYDNGSSFLRSFVRHALRKFLFAFLLRFFACVPLGDNCVSLGQEDGDGFQSRPQTYLNKNDLNSTIDGNLSWTSQVNSTVRFSVLTNEFLIRFDVTTGLKLSDTDTDIVIIQLAQSISKSLERATFCCLGRRGRV